ncbi:MAG TPA: S-methyl-5-thioribose-1-phosphate isomerase [Burkholderiaceae bacterium]|nr:S-methyl-5-thioribose-1-phosphate isomerase [Burkholderiaceae bacterium]
MQRSIWTGDDGRLYTYDQTRLPFELRVVELDGEAACAAAIRDMVVRGAPLIGAVGAYGLAFALRDDPGDASLRAAGERLAATRPTAVNLRWAIDRVTRRVAPLAPAGRAAAARDEADRLCDEDVVCNQRIGEQGARLLAGLPRAGRPLRVLTHCNAGSLATVAWGTALAPLYRLHADGVPLEVWVDETRPRNQGAALTAWELNRAGIPHRVIADNAGGLLMMRGDVDAVIVGCDRVAANGDVANKVGTYLKALAAHAHRVPFYVACPLSTLDPETPDGASITVEHRSAREVTHITGRAADGGIVEVQLVPDGSAALNPAFDITPAALVTALITEAGVCGAERESIAALLAAGGEGGAIARASPGASAASGTTAASQVSAVSAETRR